MSSALWLVALRRSGFAMLADPRTVERGAGAFKTPPFIDPNLLSLHNYISRDQ